MTSMNYFLNKYSRKNILLYTIYKNLILSKFSRSAPTPKYCVLKSEWLLFNAKWVMFQLYHNKLHFDEMMMMSTLY
jgi:hypothetical protein